MSETLAAYRYAKALMDLAKESKQAEALEEDMRVVREAIAKSEELRDLLGNPVLNTAEKLLKKYASDSHGTEIEVVANASAIKMLRSGYSPYAERVSALQEKYFNLTFLACKDAMDHVRELENLEDDVNLLPDVEVTPSALEHILERMNEGWVYLNV